MAAESCDVAALHVSLAVEDRRLTDRTWREVHIAVLERERGRFAFGRRRHCRRQVPIERVVCDETSSGPPRESGVGRERPFPFPLSAGQLRLERGVPSGCGRELSVELFQLAFLLWSGRFDARRRVPDPARL